MAKPDEKSPSIYKPLLCWLTLSVFLFESMLTPQPVRAEPFASPPYYNGDFIWAKNMGGAIMGASDATGFGLTLDSSGNIYTTGYFQRTTDFDPGPGTYNLTSAGGGDIFVSKLGNVTLTVFLPLILHLNASAGRRWCLE